MKGIQTAKEIKASINKSKGRHESNIIVHDLISQTESQYNNERNITNFNSLSKNDYLQVVRNATGEWTVPKGWKVGDDIRNLTSKGNLPKWNTVRQRYWKNQAYYNSNNYSAENVIRMQQGLAPQRLNPVTGLMESMELHHHMVPQRDGGLFDFIQVWPNEHLAIDPYRR